jgi:hypothetical protein
MFYEVLMQKSASKRAAKQDEREEQKRRGRRSLAALGVLGGSQALGASAPLVTGRRTLYHGTTKDVAKKIREEGLAPAISRDADGTIKTRGGNVMEAAQPIDFLGRRGAGYSGFEDAAEQDKFFDTIERLRKATDPDEIEALKAELPRGRGGRGSVYLDPNKYQARYYANQQAAIARDGINNPLTLQMYQQGEGRNPLSFLRLGEDADVVKARVPYALERRMIENPEVAYHEDVTLKNPFLMPQQKLQIEAANKALKGEYVLPGELGPEYMVGSDKFKRHSLDEFKEYVSGNKGRFAKGVGLAGVGAAGVGLGARELYRQFKERKKD